MRSSHDSETQMKLYSDSFSESFTESLSESLSESYSKTKESIHFCIKKPLGTQCWQEKTMSLEYMFCTSGMDLLWGGKTRRRSFISESEIFISEIKWSFFEIGQLSKSSEARFWQSRSRKRTIWSRKWKFCSKKGISLRVLLPKKQVNSRGTDIFSMFLTRDDPTTRSVGNG